MREIKFRQPVFRNDNFNGFHYWGEVEDNIFIAPVKDSTVSVGDSQQYTGLKDKNGVEIYEGYILTDRDSGDYYSVEWNDNWPGLIIRYSDGFWLSLEKSNSHEIIGNIYENPELLEGEK